MANKLTKWLRLDNSAKIYPMLISKKSMNMFRLSAELDEAVDKDVLQEALKLTISRFPSFNVKLMKGIFWYYYEENTAKPFVVEESDVILDKITFQNNKGFNFRVGYFNNRITVDFFHAIADGSGGMEFLKSLLYTYLNLRGDDVLSEQKVITVNTPIDGEEIEDSFLKYYKHKKMSELPIKDMKGAECYKIDGILYNNNGKGLIEANFEAKKLLDVCHERGCTVTEFLGGLLLYSIFMTKMQGKPTASEMQLFCPINLRKIFPSRTLRNFSLFSRVNCSANRELTLDMCIDDMKESLERDLDKEYLSNKISTTVRAEKLFIMRITPLFLKQGIFNIANKFFGKPKTATFSNLGIAQLPESMAKHVKRIGFVLNTKKDNPSNMAVVTYNGRLNISFSRSIMDNDIERFFVRYLTEKLGISVEVRSNFWEVDNAL